ncbi:chloride channel protein [Gammaproteobacteria bacterium]|nr:chloride channel protein [Gammaproteobacteria bacterium]
MSKRQIFPRTSTLRNRWHRLIEAQRLRMAYVDALPQLALLGVVSGLLSGAIIILFRLVVDIGAETLFPMDTSEAYESISPLWRFVIAVVGGLVVGILFQLINVGSRHVGVVHVIERLNYHQGHLPLRNATMQFAGAALSIVFGHSVGREGPNIHLGATSGSLLGQRLGLPNNSVRTLVGCGVAAAIAAGFNTPLAGVIFAMEVVLMEYTIIGFVPIILAAVSATALTRLVYGEEVLFIVSAQQWNTLDEFFYVLALGVTVGALAAAFIRLTLWISKLSSKLDIWVRLLLAGTFVGLIAVPVPQVMGIGYDTLNSTLLGELAVLTLAMIVAGKLLATSACIGLGSPGGLIGPTLLIGAAAGGLLAEFATATFGAGIFSSSYAIFGMGAMMAATLQAPLAALLALLEMTADPNLIMPGMIAVVSAVLVTRVVFRCPSIYQLALQSQGLDYHNDPVSQTLRRIGIVRAMDRKFARAPVNISRAEAITLLRQSPHWVLVSDGDDVVALLLAADLDRYISDNREDDAIDLLEIPATRKDVSRANIVASLHDALQLLNKSGKEALYITGAKGRGLQRVYGVLTKEDIERSYHVKR